MKYLQTWRRVLLSPVAVVLGLSLALVVINILFAHKVSPYNSDDVSWQTILTTWQPFNGHMATMGGKDNFIVHAPLLWLFDHIFGLHRRTLFIEASFFAVCNFALFYIASLYFLKKCQVRLTYFSLLPFLWLASFGHDFAWLFTNTNWRDFEEGVSFIYFMLAAMVYFGDVRPLKSRVSQVVTAGVSILAGIFAYSDPYFLYFTIFPIVASFVMVYLLKKTSGRRLTIVLSAVVLALVSAVALKHVAARLGLFSPPSPPLQFVDFTSFLSQIVLAVESILTIFGANFFGHRVASLSGVTAIMSFAALAFIIRSTCMSIRNPGDSGKGEAPPTPMKAFFAALSLFVVIVFVLSNGAVDILSYRYFIIMVYAITLLFALYIATVRKDRMTIAAIAVVIIVLNMLNAFDQYKHPQPEWFGHPTKAANATNYQLIDTIKSLGLTKGYAGYWDGSINTFLSGGSIKFLPVLCDGSGQTNQYSLLVDTSLFKQSPGKSFYLADPDTGSPQACSQQQATTQFGTPQQVVHIQDKTILVYGYDIASKIRQ